ncbi:winged helix-turn-helix domain-containing protein [Massilia solisilvae]|uniref:Winged helix-turn-helix domain-containing protein n=1 Tax=Massilia solisilvae TaxID=1811225 RepID=A0ABT2BHE8_9BURK|nr:winged helix-turn-helix domain-containing protein [Massilia solisilvae]MCS0607931.1 winged helix-turn-helix domain-containing protein [Massilia solisilvae]
MTTEQFRFGEWDVSRAGNSLQRGDERFQIEPRAMDVLFALCARANEVISTEELLLECWGSTVYGDNPVHKTITQLRRVLADSAANPSYIQTIRKRGYRAIAPVSFGDPAAQVQPGSWRDGSPFRGLQPFDADHAAIFFGRDTAVNALRSSLAGQARAGRPLVVVLGPSGSGKTSLILAGLVPALMREQRAGEPHALSSAFIDLGELHDGQVFAGLASAMLDWQLGDDAVFGGESGVSLGRLLQADPDEVAARIDRALDAHGAGRDDRLVLVIDRFEALFTHPQVTAAQREAAVSALDTLARAGRVMVIIACRNDFYPRIAEFPALLEGKAQGAHFDVERPSLAEITQMIRLPALAANLTYGVDPQTQERCDELLARGAAASPDSLPLLQYTLQELYRLRSPEGELSVEAYHRIGGLEGAIGARAEEVIAGLTAAQVAALPRVLSLVVTVSADSDTVTSRRAPWSALRSDTERELVNALVDARLFQSELVDGEGGFGVAHEALLRRWPRAANWIASHRGGLQVRSRIAQWTARWAVEGRSSDLLLPPGKQLDEARELLSMSELSLSALERELIDASARKARRRDQVRLMVMVAIVMLAIIAGAASLVAYSSKRVAQQRRAEAEGLMGFMLGDFADKLRPLGRLDLLDSVSGKALEYLAINDDSNAASLTNRAKALQVIAEVSFARSDSKAALSALDSARAILLHQLGASPQNWEVVKGLGANAFWRGRIYLSQGDLARAEEQIKLYQQYSERLYKIDPENVEGWIEQSYAHTNLGQFRLKRGDAVAAASDFAASIALKQRALLRRPSDKVLSAELANSLSWLASTRESLGALDDALKLYDKEVKVVSQLYESSPSDSLWAKNTAVALQRRGWLKAMMGQTKEGEADLAQAEQLLSAVVIREPNHRVWKVLLAGVELNRLRLQLTHAGRLVLPALQTAVENASKLVVLSPDSRESALALASAYQYIGIVLLEVGRDEEARTVLSKSLERLQALFANNPGEVRYAGDLAQTMVLLSQAYAGLGNPVDAKRSCSSALDVLGQISVRSDYRLLDPFVRAHLCLGNVSAAVAGHARLASIGYHEASYSRFFSSHQKMRESLANVRH